MGLAEYCWLRIGSSSGEHGNEPSDSIRIFLTS